MRCPNKLISKVFLPQSSFSSSCFYQMFVVPHVTLSVIMPLRFFSKIYNLVVLNKSMFRLQMLIQKCYLCLQVLLPKAYLFSDIINKRFSCAYLFILLPKAYLFLGRCKIQKVILLSNKYLHVVFPALDVLPSGVITKSLKCRQYFLPKSCLTKSFFFRCYYFAFMCCSQRLQVFPLGIQKVILPSGVIIKRLFCLQVLLPKDCLAFRRYYQKPSLFSVVLTKRLSYLQALLPKLIIQVLLSCLHVL